MNNPGNGNPFANALTWPWPFIEVVTQQEPLAETAEWLGVPWTNYVTLDREHLTYLGLPADRSTWVTEVEGLQVLLDFDDGNLTVMVQGRRQGLYPVMKYISRAIPGAK